MANILSPQDILKIALRVEENGRTLYETLEKKTQDEKLKTLWRHLKEAEEDHCKIFQGMLEKVGDYVVYEFSAGEYDAYVRAIASEYIFTPDLIEKKTRELFKSDLEALDFGLYIEKESILVYSALKEYVLTDKQIVLTKVIDEEKRHLAQLVSLKRLIEGG